MIDPHTLEVNVVLHKKCTTCRRVLPVDTRVRNSQVGDTTTNVGDVMIACGWQSRTERHKTVEQHVRSAVTRANRRSRLRRSKGDEITNDGAMRLWESCEGKCANCRVKLNWDFHPRVYNENKAVLDRVETSENLSYAGTPAGCALCATREDGTCISFRQKSMSCAPNSNGRKKKRECVDYASILIG